VKKVGWPQSQTPPPLPGWPRPGSRCTRRSSRNTTTGCPPARSRCRCPASSAARRRGDGERAAGRRTAAPPSSPSPRRRAGRRSSPGPSAWRSWRRPRRGAGAVWPAAPPTAEVCSRSSPPIGRRRSWRRRFGRPRQQMCRSCKRKLKRRARKVIRPTTE